MSQTRRRRPKCSEIKPLAFEPTAARAGRRQSRRVNVLLLSLLSGLGLALIPAWFLLTAESVQLRFEPTPDRVELVGAPDFRLTDRYLIRPGSYTLIAEKQGYYRLEEKLEIGTRSNQSYRFNLRRLPGKVAISTFPAGARVTIGGKARGTTPLEGLELAAGEHEIQLRAEGYVTHAATLEVEGGGKEQTLVVDLIPRSAPVTLKTEPPGATIVVADKALGTTPATVTLSDGLRNIRLELTGYKPAQLELQVEPNQPLAPPTVTLKPADGQLVLSSRPAGAAVSVDGEFKGRTPLTLALSPDTSHQLRLTKAGHKPVESKVEIGSGQRRESRFDLTPIYGEVRVKASPEDAQLYVDGEAKGEANQTLELLAVSHSLEIRKPGYADFKTTVTPRPGFPQAIAAKLLTEDEAKAADRPQRITSPAGQSLVLIPPPGSFQMGASRREPGRRANETLHRVSLDRPYYLGTHEVTNAEFAKFDRSHSSGRVQRLSLGQDSRPVVNLSWQQAAHYCNWLSEQAGLPAAYKAEGGTIKATEPMTTGYRLPTEAEWAWAARYAGGESPRKYAWGSAWPPSGKAGNYADQSAAGLVGRPLEGYDDGYPATAPVASYAANPLGVFDLGGNVAEWMHDFYGLYTDTAGDKPSNPTGPKEGRFHVIRGASWMHSGITELRLSYRDYGDQPRPDLGFRIARYAE